jgi:hypothetical protein
MAGLLGGMLGVERSTELLVLPVVLPVSEGETFV